MTRNVRKGLLANVMHFMAEVRTCETTMWEWNLAVNWGSCGIPLPQGMTYEEVRWVYRGPLSLGKEDIMDPDTNDGEHELAKKRARVAELLERLVETQRKIGELRAKAAEIHAKILKALRKLKFACALHSASVGGR